MCKILASARRRTFAAEPNVAAIFLNHGKPYAVGERLVQPRLASTLTLIAKDGTGRLLQGPHRQSHRRCQRARMAASCRCRTSPATRRQWAKPVTCDYRGYTIVSAPPPSSGGTTVCEILQIVKAYPMRKYGYASVMGTHYLVEAERHAFADRNTDLGDPAFVTEPDRQAALAAAHAAKIRTQIRPDKATPSSEVHGMGASPEGTHTTHFSVVDAKGNAVSVTYTINFLFGSGKIAGDTGFFLNDEMDDFTSKPGVPNAFGLVQGKANQIEPGKRPLSSMTPTIVLKDGKLFMVTGSPGGSTIISTTLESILNVVDFGMNMQQAVDAPRIHHQWLPDMVMVEPGYLTDEDASRARSDGLPLPPVSSWGADEAILRNPKTGLLEGANDQRRSSGLAAGY